MCLHDLHTRAFIDIANMYQKKAYKNRNRNNVLGIVKLHTFRQLIAYFNVLFMDIHECLIVELPP